MRAMQGGAGYVLGTLSLAARLASLRRMSSLPIAPLFLAQTPVPACSRAPKAMAPPYSCTGAHLGGAADTDAASTRRYLLPLAHLWIPMALHVGAPPPWPTLVPCEEEEEEAKFPVPELCVKHSRQLQTSVVGSCIAMADAEQLWRTHLRPYLLFRRAMEANVKGNGSSDMCKVVHGGLRGQHGLEKVWRYSKCHYSEGCLRAPSFGFAGQRGRYCSLHRQANHTNLKNKLCRFAGGCSTAASFGPPRQRALTCAKHRLPSHIDLRNRLRCKEAGCDRRARYKSVASLPADLCSKHRNGAGPQSKSKADGEQGAEGGSTDEGAGNLSGVREPVDVCETPPPAVD